MLYKCCANRLFKLKLSFDSKGLRKNRVTIIGLKKIVDCDTVQRQPTKKVKHLKEDRRQDTPPQKQNDFPEPPPPRNTPIPSQQISYR